MEKESVYEKLEKIGEGAYGAVYRAVNTKTKTIVALKISRFEDFDEGIPSTCMREITILKNIQHPNLVKQILHRHRVYDAKIFHGANPRLQIAFEFIDYDLSKFIRKHSENLGKGLSEYDSKVLLSFCQIIIKSILSGIQHLHQNGILHRDLKPHNILITKDHKVQVADFGLGRICSFPLQTMSKEIETLWYRAPQLLLGTKKYGEEVDAWSIGCIFFELLEGKALFQSESQIGQLFEIFRILGTPRKNEWPQIVNMQEFKPTFPKFTPNPPYFKKLSLEGQKWLFKLLNPNPKKRMTVTKALNDMYLNIW